LRIRPGPALTLAVLVLATVAPIAAEGNVGEPTLQPVDPVAILESLHADFDRYIHTLRIITTHAARVSPRALYSGLVRRDGMEPRSLADAPESGPGVRNDVLVFPAAIDSARSPGWIVLILDHEYFHARHLAHGWRTPVADFGEREPNRDYYEAVAWSYVLERALLGVYGDLTKAEMREVRAKYRRHRVALRRMIRRRQPAAWAHYSRFLFDPEDPSGGGALRESRLR
jgi:hypothetical protein